MTVHAAAAATAVVLLPRGFPPNDIHTWGNTWVPAFVVLTLAVALARFVFMRSSARPVSLGTAGIAGGWLAAVLAGSILFPVSFGIERAIGPGAIGLAFAVLAWATRIGIAESVGAAIGGGVLGGDRTRPRLDPGRARRGHLPESDPRRHVDGSRSTEGEVARALTSVEAASLP